MGSSLRIFLEYVYLLFMCYRTGIYSIVQNLYPINNITADKSLMGGGYHQNFQNVHRKHYQALHFMK